jgi:hypothetical protein
LPLAEAVQKSDLVVVATLTGVRQWTDDGRDYGRGTLRVTDVLWGNVSKGDTLALEWSNQSTLACPRVEHRREANRSIVWFLTLEENGAVHADHPHRTLPVDQIERVKRTLAEYPFQLRIRSGYDPGEPVEVSIVLRNATASSLEVPRIDWDGDTLWCTAGVELKLVRWTKSSEEVVSVTTPRPDWERPLLLEPGEQETIRFRLDEIVDLAQSSYRVLFRTNPQQELCRYWTTIRTPWQARVASFRDGPEWIPFLRRVLRGEEGSGDPAWAIRALQFSGSARASEAHADVAALFPTGGTQLKRILLQALPWFDRSLGANRAVLTAALADSAREVRLDALWIVGRLQPDSLSRPEIDEVLDEILPFLDSDDVELRRAAVRSLHQFPPDGSVETLLETISGSDPDEHVRREAWNVWKKWRGIPSRGGCGCARKKKL